MCEILSTNVVLEGLITLQIEKELNNYVLKN